MTPEEKTQHMLPEEKAREKIDKQLIDAGWDVVSRDEYVPKGNTEIVAEFIEELAGADLFEVETVKEYAADYYECIEDAKAELKRDERPELKKYLDSIDGYDNVVVAAPCWWGTYPMGVFTQLDRLDFSGKRVFPVITHEGSGLSGAPKALKEHCKGAEIGEGLAIHGAEATSSKPAVEKWVKENLGEWSTCTSSAPSTGTRCTATPQMT